uniref:Uncharacterized protein n=1 Tax=Parascaris univalens TaxID=6257 RepID=A0A915BPB6_PARUN
MDFIFSISSDLNFCFLTFHILFIKIFIICGEIDAYFLRCLMRANLMYSMKIYD